MINVEIMQHTFLSFYIACSKIYLAVGIAKVEGNVNLCGGKANKEKLHNIIKYLSYFDNERRIRGVLLLKCEVNVEQSLNLQSMIN
jgi:hypothetical protein